MDLGRLVQALAEWLPGCADWLYARFAIGFAVLMAAAGLIFLILWLTPAWKSISVQRAWLAYRSWLLVGPLVLLAIGRGRETFIIGTGILSVLFVKEFARATGLYNDWGFVAAIYAGIGGFFWAALVHWYGLFVAMPVYGTVLLFMIPALRNAYAGMIQRVGLSSIALVYLGWFPAHLAFLANHPYWRAYVLFLIVGTEINDAAAYVVSKAFGRRQLTSNISPKKTIEGAIGSLIAVTVYVWIVGQWLPSFTPPLFLLCIAIFWIGGTVGSLVMSVVKRDIGIHGMGSVIPGHGGLSDRCDSLIFTSPLFFHMINYYVRFPGGAS